MAVICPHIKAKGKPEITNANFIRGLIRIYTLVLDMITGFTGFVMKKALHAYIQIIE